MHRLLVCACVCSCLRRAATLCVIVLDRLILGKVAPRGEVVSVVFMMVGAIVAYWGDLTFSAPGYFLIAINCFVSERSLCTMLLSVCTCHVSGSSSCIIM